MCRTIDERSDPKQGESINQSKANSKMIARKIKGHESNKIITYMSRTIDDRSDTKQGKWIQQ